jgi:pRiA4b ORF-3-like protein
LATARKTPLRAVKASAPVYVLRIELLDLRPAIWRRLMVPGSIKLDKLHTVLRVTMGWDGGHLHDFDICDQHYGPPFDDPMGGVSVEDESKATLAAALGGAKSFHYLYDFGDGWDHKVKIEKVLPADPTLKCAVCLDGAHACPPDDVGGPPGYVDFLEAIADPDHEEHDHLLEWCGGEFDSYAFSTESVNQILCNIKV